MLGALVVIVYGIAVGTVLRRLLGDQPGRLRAFLVAIASLALLSESAVPVLTAVGLTPSASSGAGTLLVSSLVLGLLFVGSLVVALGVLVVWELVVPTGRLPGPLEAAVGVRDGARRALRYLELSWVVASSGLWRRLRLGPSDPAFSAAVVRTLERSGPTFVKVGQILSTRVQNLPPALTAALARLQSAAEPAPSVDVEALLRDEWGEAPSTRLASFDPVPFAAASIAQVHAATLHDGTRVVVKVQRPGAAPRVRVDADILVRFATDAERRWNWARGMGLRAIATGLRGSLLEELDYRIEARNTQALARALADRPLIATPRIVPELSGERVLVMTRLDGGPVATAADALPTADRERLARELAGAVLTGVLVQGVFHADLHPGNVLVLDDGRIGLLDFGAIGVIDAETRALLGTLLLAVLQDDTVGAVTALEMAFEVGADTDRAAMRRELGRLVTLSRYSPDPVGTLVGELFAFLTRFGIVVPGDVAGAFRTVVALLGVLRALAPELDQDSFVRGALPDLVTRAVDPARLAERVVTRSSLALALADRVPGRLERVSAQLADGSFAVRTRTFADQRDRDFVRAVVDDVASAVFATILFVGAVWLGTTPGGPELATGLALYPLLGAMAAIGAFALAFRLVIRLFRYRRDR
nr:AarF/UbiB family protein [Pseudoclavibacter chungangensis]